MQLQQILIKAVNNKDKTCGILIDTPNGETWINGFRTGRTEQLNKGETIQVYIYQEEYNGKTYTKFKLPSLDALMAQTQKNTPGSVVNVQNGHVHQPNQIDQTVVSHNKELSVEDLPF